MRDCAMRSSVMSFSASRLPKATRFVRALAHQLSARSATPIWRMQWWMRPGPEPALRDLEARALAQQHVGGGHAHVLEEDLAVAVGRVVVAEHGQHADDLDAGRVARDQDHRLLLVAGRGSSASVLPMKMRTLQRGSPMPEVHHLWPLMT